MSTPLTTRRRSLNLNRERNEPAVCSPQTRRSNNLSANSQQQYESPLPEVRNEEDWREKKEKRRSRNLTVSASSPFARPPDDSLGETAKLTNDQLASHYVNCIKLSTENKITAKNAFSLHLIDHMNEMLKQRCEGALNFQMAGGTIFASAKIYASRVDAVHSEAYKMMSSLGRGSNEEKDANAGSDHEDSDDNEKRDAGRKKKKRSKILENNSSSLRLKKLEVGYQTDPLDQYYASVFDVANTSGLLINHLRLCKDGVTVRYDSEMESPSPYNVCGSSKQAIGMSELEDEQPMDVDPANDVQFKDAVDSLYSDLNKLGETIKKASICPMTDDFTWNEGDQSLDWDDIGKSSVAGDSDFGSMPDVEASDDHDDVIQDPAVMDDDDCHFAVPSQESIIESTDKNGVTIGMDEELLTAFEPGEYSYFKSGLISTWEGPNHWKMKLHGKPSSASTAKSTEPERTTKTRKRKRAFYIDYSSLKIDIDERELEQTKKPAILTRRMREKLRNSENDQLLPSAGEYNMRDLAKCYLQAKVIIKPIALIRSAKQEAPEVDTNELGMYNYNNANDKNNYCPNLSDDEVNLQDDPGAHGDDIPTNFVTDYADANDTAFPDSTLSQAAYQTDLEAMLKGDHLISHPRKVEKISIAYAKRATRIDVRKLKAAMWNVLNGPDENEEVSPDTKQGDDSIMDDPSASQKSEKTFSTLYYAGLPELVPKTMAESLSIPLAFTCLLHLANEKSLDILAEPDMSDLNIAVPADTDAG